MKNKKLKWSWKHYSFQPDVSYAKIKDWPVWLIPIIAAIGIVGIGYVVARGN